MVLNDQEEKGMTEDEMAHHQLNERGFENTLGCSEGQGCLTRCSPWGLKSSEVTQQLNNNGCVPSSLERQFFLLV